LRHYWIVLKLLITIFATIVLLIYIERFSEMAGMAADPSVALGVVRNPSPVVHAVLALLLLVSATVLAVYKPLGLTAYGMRKLRAQPTRPPNESSASGTRWVYLSSILGIGVLILFVVLHLMGGGLRGH
jgi:hypothetical protein